MEIVGIQCNGCGSSNVYIDHARRIIKCNQCGKEEAYTRASMNANNKVVFCVENAMRFFKEGRFDDARKYAYDALNISKDNIPALFIFSFHDEFIEKKHGAMKQFFKQAKDVLLEYDELEQLRALLLTAVTRLQDYESDVIMLVATNMQTVEDEKPLCEFIDTFCPYLIMKRPSTSYLTPELIDMYKELAAHCSIPKTCFALLKSIDINPESPIVRNDFHLRAKAKFFYESYLSEIGSIIGEIRDKSIRDKFEAAFLNKKTMFEKSMDV